VAFVVDKFNAGVGKGQIAFEALQALNGVDASYPAQYVNAKAILDNKAAVSEYYSVTVGVSQTDIDVLQSVLNGITADTATVTSAEAEIDAGTRGSAGVELTLTPSQDSVVGSAAADVVNGLFGDVTASNNTYTAGDSIDGGAGTDNLNLVALGTTASSAIIVKNVEAINI
jgi:S-layer protein